MNAKYLTISSYGFVDANSPRGSTGLYRSVKDFVAMVFSECESLESQLLHDCSPHLLRYFSIETIGSAFFNN